ncbi:hypothetical protein ACXYMU_08620 [Pontibacter sp. CAU 1760]
MKSSNTNIWSFITLSASFFLLGTIAYYFFTKHVKEVNFQIDSLDEDSEDYS